MSRRRVWGWSLAGIAAAVAAGAAEPGPVFDLEGFDRDAPVSIRADSLEATETEGARTLRFERNVVVEQGDLWIRAGRIEATYPTGSREPSRLRGRGGVRLGQGGREAHCDRVDYDRATQLLVCRGDAFLRDGDDELRGDAIVFDLAARRVRVEGATRVAMASPVAPGAVPSLAPEDLATAGPVVIRADSLEGSETDEGRWLTFEGGVEAAQQDLVLRAARVRALYPPDADEPSLLSATGGVRIEQEDQEARCDEAVYDRSRQRVECRGSARLQKGEDHVTGDQMSFDLANERLLVTGDPRLVLAPRAREAASR